MGDAETLASVNALSSQVRPRDPPAAVAEGARIADRYRVVALLGRGGYGEVYRVADELDGGRPLALKLYRVGAAPPEALDALRGEFSLLASLHHPHRARVHDFGQVGELAFFTQELVEGVPAHHAGLDLGSERLVRLVAQLARALDYLHGRDLLHGDIKPSNVLIDVEREHLTLLDFGIARSFGRVGEQVAGTFGYLAPELLLGGSVDGRADLYAVGALLYRLASGRVPFHGTPSEIVTAQLEGPPPPLPASMPPALARIVERLLALDPAARFASAAELVQELSRATGVVISGDVSLTSFVLGARSVGLDPERARLVELLEAR
ncbi:MAG: serine/threonine protein kinase, partial [Sandaracinaceae bacterium]|nr:serine/threonine protein kinase [Sandaracinaceae bacterium]